MAAGDLTFRHREDEGSRTRKLNQLVAEVAAGGGGGASAAEDVSFTPAGTIGATDVQAAIEELGTEKAASVHTHTLAAITDAGTAAAADVGDFAAAGHDHDADYAPIAHTHTLADVTDAGTAAAADAGDFAAAVHGHAIADVTDLQTALDGKLDSANYTAADVLTKIKTVDGAGSGLDADTLDGNDATAFATAGHTHDASYVALTGNQTIAGDKTFSAGGLTLTTTAGLARLYHSSDIFFFIKSSDAYAQIAVSGVYITGDTFLEEGSAAGELLVNSKQIWHEGNFEPSDYSGIPGSRVSGRFYDNSEAGNNSGTGALTANQIILTPFSVASDFTIDQIGFAVSTAVAGNAKVVCYTSDANNAWPDAHQFTATAQSTGTTGAKMASQSFTFLAGVQYWVGIWADAAPTIRTVAAASTQNMGLTGSNATTYATGIQRTLAYGAAPNPWTFAASELANLGTFPSIRMRAA